MKTFYKILSLKIFRPEIQLASMMLIIMVVYWKDLSILVNEAFRSEAVSHIIFVPFLISYLMYRKKESVKASLAFEKLQRKTKLISLGDIIGIAFCLSAFILYWLGSCTFYPLEYHIISMPMFFTGMTLILFNIKTLLVLIFPILFLAFLIPPPSDITYAAGTSIANFSSQVSYTLLRIVGLPVTLSSEYGPPTIVLDDPIAQSFGFTVDLSCSGIYSLIAFFMFATFLAYILRGSLTKKAVLLTLGFLILQILNIIRISLTVSVAHWLGEETAMTIFHVFTGWLLIFFGMLSLLLIAEKLLRLRIFSSSNEVSSCSHCEKSLKNQEFFCSNCGKFLTKTLPLGIFKRFWVKMPALLLASCLFTFSTQVSVYVFAQGLTIIIPSPQLNTEAFPEIEGYELNFLYRDVNFEKISHQDASLVYVYSPLNISTPSVYVLLEVAGSITNLHNLEVCAVINNTRQITLGRPPLLSVLDSRDVRIIQNPPIIARYFVFQHPEEYTQITLYWYEKALFNTGIAVEQRYVRISLITLTENPTDYPQREKILFPFANSIARHWEPVKSKILISQGIPVLQSLLVIFICFAIMKGAIYLRDQRKRSNNLKIFKRFASQNEKLVFQTIQSMSEYKKELTTQAIAFALKKNTGNYMQSNELMNVLSHLEKYELLKRDITILKDKSVLIWNPMR